MNPLDQPVFRVQQRRKEREGSFSISVNSSDGWRERKKCGTATAAAPREERGRAARADSCIIIIMVGHAPFPLPPSSFVLPPSAVDLFVAEWMKGLRRERRREGERERRLLLPFCSGCRLPRL